MSIFKWLSELEIINWNKVNTYSFFGGLFFTICHPIYAWKYDRNCYGSFLNRCENFFKRDMWKYMPCSKACRWLAHNLVHRAYDTKYIDDFYSRQCGDFTTYFSGKALFGYYRVTKLYWKHQGNGYAKSPKKTIIASGFVWRKKTAFKLFKKIILANPKIYNPKGDAYPEVEDRYYMKYTDYMLDILHTGKMEHNYIDATHLDLIYKHSKDNIEKLWCYVSDLLLCRNDFDAHEFLVNIESACDIYIYHKNMKSDPTIDFTYNNTLKRLGKAEAEKWKNSQVRQHSKAKMLPQIEQKIEELRQFYIDMSYEYYRI